MDWGNPPIHSTLASFVTNPSTSSLIDELDSTVLGTKDLRAGQHRLFQVAWIAGADTIATFVFEHATSTALADSTTTIMVRTPTNQSGQWVTAHKLGPNDRLRIRVNSTFTGNAFGRCMAHIMT